MISAQGKHLRTFDRIPLGTVFISPSQIGSTQIVGAVACGAIENDCLFSMQIRDGGRWVMLGEDQSRTGAGGNPPNGLRKFQRFRTHACRAAKYCQGWQAGALHVAELLQKADAMWHSARTRIAAGDNPHTHGMSAAEHLLVPLDDPLQMANDLAVPAKRAREINL
jgi:hypothetical protein